MSCGATQEDEKSQKQVLRWAKDDSVIFRADPYGMTNN
jgi:hypothetical protein